MMKSRIGLWLVSCEVCP